MSYTRLCKPRMSDCNRNGKVSYEALFNILEEVGSIHSDLADDNVMDGSKGGLAWILADWRMEILRRPDYKDELTVETFIRAEVNAFNVYRDFLVKDKLGNAVAKAEAKLVLLDTRVKNLVRISEELCAAYKVEDRNVFDTAAGKLREAKAYSNERDLILRRSDIDFNGHVHNTRYVDFATEALPKEEYLKDDLKSIRIVYRKPVAAGTAFVTIKYAFEGGHKVGIYNDEELCTLIELK